MTRKIFKKLQTMEEAWKIFFSHLNLDHLQKTEVKLISEARGYVLAEDVISTIDVPPFDKTTVDGYAVIAEDTFAASEENPVELRVIGSVPAGDWFEHELTSGQAVEVSTGAPIPHGANAVVMVEDTVPRKETVEILRAVPPRANIMSAGTDIMYGEIIVRKGTVLGVREISLIAAIGLSKVKVFSKPRVAVISTGNELVSQGTELPPGKIYDINTWAIAESIHEAGGVPIVYGIVEDDEEKLREVMSRAVQENELVTISGGTSAGAGDLIYRIIDDLGSPGILVHGIKVQPGKPTILSIVNDIPLIGLPGNPTSGLMIFHVFVSPIIKALSGQALFESERIVKAILPMRVRTPPGREQFLLVNLSGDSKGNYYAFPVPGGSGSITTLTRAVGFARIPSSIEYVEKGSTIDVTLFLPKDQIPEVSILTTHCLGLEKLISGFINDNPQTASKVSVIPLTSEGSLAGVKNGEADIAGINLPNSSKAGFNTEAFQRENDGSLLLVEGYEREIGFLILPKLSQKIGNFSDIINNNLRIMKSQRGSGWAYLLDAHMAKEAERQGTTVEELKERINFLHQTAKTDSVIARNILLGRCDTGIGTKFIAENFGLSFLPVGREQLDLVVRRDRLDKPLVKHFLDFLTTQKAKETISSISGYFASQNMGEEIGGKV